jgi:hypothetical protein
MPLTGVPNHAELQSQRAGPSGARQRRPDGLARGPARRCVAAQRSRAGDRRRSGGSRDRLRLGPTHCHPCAPRVSDRPVSVSGSRLPKSLRRTSQCWLSRPSGAAARCGAVASSTPVPSPGRDNSKVSPRCPLPRRRPGTGGGPAALGPWDSWQDRIPRLAEPGWPVRRERGRHRPVQPVLFARHPREYARSRLLDPVPIGERRARLGLGRRPRLTDLAEDVPVADQLPVVTPHFRPPGARRLGGLKGTVSPTSGALHENAGRPSERPHGCNEGEQRQVGPTPTPCSSSARDHDRRDRPRECRQARTVRVGATKNDMTLSTTAVTRLQGVGATAHRTADDSAVRHVRLVAPLSHASGTFDPRSWLSRAGRR